MFPIVSKQQDRKLALLFFSLSPEQEAYRKPLFGRKKRKENIQFWRHRQEETLKTLRQLQVPVETGKIAEKNNFHDHLIASMQACFDKGYERIIVVGNDTPDLQLGLLKEAVRSLKQTPTVIQPAFDGGINLLGINHQAFIKLKNAHLPWQQKELLSTLLRILEVADMPYELLPTANDLDNLADLNSYIAQESHGLLAKLVALLLNPTKNLLEHINSNKYCWPVLPNFAGRAPPQLS